MIKEKGYHESDTLFQFFDLSRLYVSLDLFNEVAFRLSTY